MVFMVAHGLDHPPARHGAFAQRLHDQLHLGIVERIARGETIVADLGAGRADIDQERAPACHQLSRRAAHLRAIDAHLGRQGVLGLLGLGLEQAVVEPVLALVHAPGAGLRALLLHLRVMAPLGVERVAIMFLGPRLLGAGPTPGDGGQPGRGRSQDSHQFTTVHCHSPPAAEHGTRGNPPRVGHRPRSVYYTAAIPGPGLFLGKVAGFRLPRREST